MSETVHVVRQGDYLPRIAAAHGFSSWRVIWEHAANAELRAQRANPNILLPGDRVVIPDKSEKTEPGESEQRHRFRVARDHLWLRVVLRGMDNLPVANTPYELKVGAEVFQGATDADGLLEQEIPVTSEEATLVVTDRSMSLKIGHLDPVDEKTGWKGRLDNLGYDPDRGEEEGDADTEGTEQTRSAVEEFQCDHGLDVDGIVGDRTEAKLSEEHGC